MNTAYAYARYSSDNQREESITAQLRAIHEYCDTHDIKILQEFKDEAFSARTSKRPAFQDMFSLIKERPADLLIVHKLDRFARSREDAAFYRSKLKEKGMKLVSVLERLDDSPESIIMEGLLDSLNEYYSANLSRESKKGIKENVLQGKRNGGKAPFGYTCVNQHLIPNKDAETVKRFFAMYAEGKRLADIANTLHLPFKNYNAVLKNEVYLGTLISKEWRHENAHEAIIDKDTWEMCQKRLKNSPHNAANRALFPYMLSGMLVCGNCGKTMHAVSCERKYFYYSCQKKGCPRYKRDELEQRVLNSVQKHFVATDDLKARFFDLVNARVNRRSKDEDGKKLNIILSQRISKLMNALQYAETQEDTKAIMDKVNEMRCQMKPKPEREQKVSRQDCDSFIESFCDIGSHDYEIQKMILQKTIDKIVVKPESLVLFTNMQTPFYITVYKDGKIKISPTRHKMPYWGIELTKRS